MTERDKANVNTKVSLLETERGLTHLPETAEGLKRENVGETVSVSENFLELMKNTNAISEGEGIIVTICKNKSILRHAIKLKITKENF